MRHSQLRRLFLDLSFLATPIPLVFACSGTVIGSSDGHDDSGGAGGMGATGGAGGYPVYVGTPAPSGGGHPIYTGTGGVPMFMGTAPAGGTGGYMYPGLPGLGGTSPLGGAGGAIYVGTGGAIFVGSGGSGGYGALPDSGLPDTGPPDPIPTDAGADACDDGAARGPSGCGRRPPGLEGAPAGIGGDLCMYFQEMARLEAASVPAFRRLGHELRLHGAPQRLLDAARRAASDEVRHTRLGRTLAERFGGRYVPPRIRPTPVRSLEELAIDNATEGGVRETFGALIATWQGRAATDPVVRRIMRRVGVDETRHAALALRVLDWTNHRLSEEGRRRVREARRSCAADVLRELEWTPPPELVSLAGVPSRDDAQRLAREMTERLWT
jgi:hypothetical protein